MNNDIVRFNMSANSAKNSTNNQKDKLQMAASEVCSVDKTVKDSMECLGNMGCAQVNMNNLGTSRSVRQAMEKFIQNPEYVQAHVDFCDGLVAKGYSLEDAIQKSDIVFCALKDENIYS